MSWREAMGEDNHSHNKQEQKGSLRSAPVFANTTARRDETQRVPLSVEPHAVRRHNWTTTHEEKAKQTNGKKEILARRLFFTRSEVFHALGRNNCIFGPQINPDTSASGERVCCSHEAFLGFIRNKSSPHSQITDFWWVSPHP